jgi:2-polyprenyl-6-methoxyphenol hydroxylase-like FAD-dependent oxidoreductase
MLNTTILIVGSGPVGLWLAYELRTADLDVLVIDSLQGRDKRTKYSKALSVSAGALETFESRGVAKRFFDSGMRMPKAHFGGVMLDLNKDVLGTQYSCNLIIPQTRTEEILLDLCDDVGVSFAWGMEFCGLTQNEQEVSVTARRVNGDGLNEDEEILIQAAWVVGCDGTHSKVREFAGIAFEGTPSTISVALADIQLSTKLPGTGILHGSDSAAGSSVVPIGDGVHYRFVSKMTTACRTPVSETPNLEQIKELLRDAFGSDFGAHSPLWFSRFGNACRVASSFRAGKVFLAGDAGHQLFPAGGQGMNLGLQDATSLAWRLVIASKGSSCESAVERMLESYSRERRVVAQAVNDNVQAQIAMVTAVNPPEIALRAIFREALKNPELNAMWARRMTGFGDPWEAYTHLSPKAKFGVNNSSPDASRGDSLVGMRATGQICGSGIEELFQATTLKRFVLLQRIGAAEREDTLLRDVLEPWKDNITVLLMTSSNTRENWYDIDALLVRPDMRVAWVAMSDEPIAEIQSSFAAVLEYWFGTQ